jgi:hypothetical protein
MWLPASGPPWWSRSCDFLLARVGRHTYVGMMRIDAARRRVHMRALWCMCIAIPGLMCPVGARAQTGGTIPADSSASRARLDSLRARFVLPMLPLVSLPASAAAAPAASLGSPTAYGAGFGDAFVGAGYQYRVRFSSRGDGAASAGAGIGNAQRLAAVEITATSYSTFRSGFARNGSVSLKLHRSINPRMAIAAGYENAIPWGDTDGGSSLYVVATRLIPLRANTSSMFGGMGLSLGAGNARFRSEDDVEQNIPGINMFGSMSLRITEPVVAVADWTGQDLNLGASIRMPGPLPVSLSLGLADVTHRAGNGARFVAGAGWAFRYK